jgi:hypothetical protein
MSKNAGAEILWATLVGEGVTTVFGYLGGAILPAYLWVYLWVSFPKNVGILLRGEF